jgi:hypothetical protein
MNRPQTRLLKQPITKHTQCSPIQQGCAVKEKRMRHQLWEELLCRVKVGLGTVHGNF